VDFTHPTKLSGPSPRYRDAGRAGASATADVRNIGSDFFTV
jgi:hypothetical protein